MGRRAPPFLKPPLVPVAQHRVDAALGRLCCVFAAGFASAGAFALTVMGASGWWIAVCVLVALADLGFAMNQDRPQ